MTPHGGAKNKTLTAFTDVFASLALLFSESLHSTYSHRSLSFYSPYKHSCPSTVSLHPSASAGINEERR